jgi:hypothetical protein
MYVLIFVECQGYTLLVAIMMNSAQYSMWNMDEKLMIGVFFVMVAMVNVVEWNGAC